MDQPQPMVRVLSIPVHVVMVHILDTCQCHFLSCFQDPEFGGLSDTSIHQTSVLCCHDAHVLNVWTMDPAHYVAGLKNMISCFTSVVLSRWAGSLLAQPCVSGLGDLASLGLEVKCSLKLSGNDSHR